jgi:hypothetical protein
MDDIAERAGLSSSDILARPFDLEMKGFVASIAGKTVPQDIFVGTDALGIVRREQKGIYNRSSELAESNALSGISKRPVKH